MSTDYRLGPIFDDAFPFDDILLENRSLRIPPLQDLFPRDALDRPPQLETSEVGSGNHTSSNAFLATKLQPLDNGEQRTARGTVPGESRGEGTANHKVARGTKQTAGQDAQTTASAPLAEVLNDAADSDVPSSAQLTQSTGNPRKRRRSQSKNMNDYVQLPKPPVRKNQKPLRIPPLLQGLHEPPPNAALFPPITIGSSFQQLGSIGDATSPPPLQSPKVLENTGKELEKSKDKCDEKGEAEHLEKKDSTKKDVSRRKKWSSEETRSLLKGVARFGVGRWKRILAHPDYKFNGRSAVDLRDRFRTCRPEDYLSSKEATKFNNDVKAAGAKYPSSNSKVENSLSVSSLLVPKADDIVAEKSPEKQRSSRSHRKDDAELASLGIRSPFVKSNRRERHVFSAEEDEALLKGYDKYGASWSDICKDAVFQNCQRKPRDLRDRFRHKYPDRYKGSGRKLGPDKNVQEQPDRNVDKHPDEKGHNNPNGPIYDPVRTQAKDEKLPTVEDVLNKKSPPPTTAGHAHAQPQAMAFLPPPLSPLHPSYFPDILFEDPFAHGDAREAEPTGNDAYSAPVVLDRSIFEWATTQHISPSAGVGVDAGAFLGQRSGNAMNGPVLPMEHTPRFIDPLVTVKPASGLF